MTRIAAKDDAVEIAMAYLRRLHGRHPALDEWRKLMFSRVTDAPARFMCYRDNAHEDVNWNAVWYVYVPWCDGLDGSALRSSRVVVVSKVGGRILYDGSANDEG